MTTTRSGPMRLFSGPLSMFGAKAQIALLEKGFDFELVMVPFEDRMTTRPAVRSVVGPMAAFLLSRGRPIPDFLSSALPSRPADPAHKA